MYQILTPGCQRLLVEQAAPESRRHVIRVSLGLLLMESGESIITEEVGNLVERALHGWNEISVKATELTLMRSPTTIRSWF